MSTEQVQTGITTPTVKWYPASVTALDAGAHTFNLIIQILHDPFTQHKGIRKPDIVTLLRLAAQL